MTPKAVGEHAAGEQADEVVELDVGRDGTTNPSGGVECEQDDRDRDERDRDGDAAAARHGPEVHPAGVGLVDRVEADREAPDERGQEVRDDRRGDERDEEEREG